MKRKIYAWLLLSVGGIIATAFLLGSHAQPAAWQRHASPGTLSVAHASLEADCESCHTPNEGAVDQKCVGCHATETALLQRQPTAFHANIGACAQCHVEHRGTHANMRGMDHAALARIGLKLLERSSITNAESAELIRWVRAHPTGTASTPRHPNVSPIEMTLDCKACHSTKDKHVGLFGSECASCHATTQWTVREFQHPPADSADCAQCHRAPPSHFMMHFDMVSKKVARQEDGRVAQCCGVAQVNQCQRCHQTTSWNDIKGVGWYKHH